MVAPSVALPDLSIEALELLELFVDLDESARRDLLAVARGWVKVEP